MASSATSQPDAEFSHRYLRVQDLRNLRHQVFSPRRPVEGLYAGRHTSPQRGHAAEFSDYREYVPGDDLADIDWKVYGRSDRLYIKQFEHQAGMSVHLLVDASASMDYAGMDDARASGDSWLSRVHSAGRKLRGRVRDNVFANPTKYDQACLLAAAIAFLIVKQQDRVALGRAREGLQDFLPPQGSFRHLGNVLKALEGKIGSKARLADAIEQYAARTRRRGLFLIFSDLMEEPDEMARALSLLAHRSMEVIVFHVLHRDELQLPDLAEAVFIDSESRQRVRLNVEDVRQTYHRQVTLRMQAWTRLFRTRGIDYNLVTTDMHYSKALEGYLFGRAAVT